MQQTVRVVTARNSPKVQYPEGQQTARTVYGGTLRLVERCSGCSLGDAVPRWPVAHRQCQWCSPWPAGKFNRGDVTSSTFSRENSPLSNEEKRAIARLVKCKPDEAEADLDAWVAEVRKVVLGKLHNGPVQL